MPLSVVKSLTEFDVDLPRVVEVKSSKRQAVVEQHAAIRHIQRGQGNPVFLAKTFPERNIKRRVLRQIVPRILRVGHPVVESRAVVHIRRSEHLPGKSCIETQVQSVSLIVVHRRISRGRICEHVGVAGRADQASGEGRGCLRDLIRIGQVKLTAAPEARGAQCGFPTLNQGGIPGDRPEEIRFADIVVIQPILAPAFESVGVERPAAKRNRDAELVFVDRALRAGERKSDSGCWPNRATGRWRSAAEAAGKRRRRSRERPSSGAGLLMATPKRGSTLVLRRCPP